jgi:hypothetical protein
MSTDGTNVVQSKQRFLLLFVKKNSRNKQTETCRFTSFGTRKIQSHSNNLALAEEVCSSNADKQAIEELK